MNPYMPYREPQKQDNTFAQILAGLKLGLDAYSTYQTGAIADRRVNLDEQEQRIRGDQFAVNKGMEQEKINLMRTGQGIDRAKVDEMRAANALKQQESDIKFPHAQEWNESNYMRFISGAKLAGIPIEDFAGVNDLKSIAMDKSLKRGDVANISEAKWPEWSAKTAENLESKVSKLADQAANMDETDPKRQEIMKKIENTIKAQEMLESIPAERVKQIFFKDIYQYEQNAKAELLKQRSELAGKRFIATDQGLFDTIKGEIVPGTGKLKNPVSVPQGGSLVNPSTGETVFSAPPKPEAPRSVAPGGVLVDQSGKVIYQSPHKPFSDRPVSVPEGGTLVNPLTGEKIFSAPKTEKGPTSTEQRMTAKDIAGAEGKILANKSSETAAGEVDFFNQNAAKPYSYVWKPGKVYGGDWTKLPLPKIKGKQVTAKDVYDTASQRGMTYEEVLQAIGALK